MNTFRSFFVKRFGLDPQDANTVNSMIYIVAAVTSPFFGILIDKVGRNLTWVVVSILITAVAHSILIFTYLNPYIGTVLSILYIVKQVFYDLLLSDCNGIRILTISRCFMATCRFDRSGVSNGDCIWLVSVYPNAQYFMYL